MLIQRLTANPQLSTDSVSRLDHTSLSHSVSSLIKERNTQTFLHFNDPSARYQVMNICSAAAWYGFYSTVTRWDDTQSHLRPLNSDRDLSTRVITPEEERKSQSIFKDETFFLFYVAHIRGRGKGASLRESKEMRDEKEQIKKGRKRKVRELKKETGQKKEATIPPMDWLMNGCGWWNETQTELRSAVKQRHAVREKPTTSHINLKNIINS